MQINDEDRKTVSDRAAEQLEQTNPREFVLEKFLIGVGMLGSFFAHKIWLLYLTFLAVTPVGAIIVAAAASVIIIAITGYLLNKAFGKRLKVKAQVNDLNKLFKAEVANSQEHKDALDSLTLGTDKFKMAKKQAKNDIQALYQERYEATGIDIAKAEEKTLEDVDFEIEESNRFLSNMFQLFKDQEFSKDEQGIDLLRRFNETAELVGEEIKIKSDAQLFEEGVQVDPSLSKKILQINQHFEGSKKLDFSFIEREGEISDNKFSPNELRNLVRIVLNRAIIYQAIQTDTLVEKVLSKGSEVGEGLGVAKKLQKLLSSDFEPKGRRCDNICILFYGKKSISSTQYQQLFSMLDMADGEGRLSRGMDTDYISQDDKIRDAINEYSFDGLSQANALNLARQIKVVAQREDNSAVVAPVRSDSLTGGRAEIYEDDEGVGESPVLNQSNEKHPGLPDNFF